MAKGTRNYICMLSDEEAEAQIKHGVKPNCANHRHTTEIDAREMVGIGDFKPYHEPIAKPFGPKAIVMKKTFSFRGLSCRIFEYHLKALAQGKAWARVMLQDMRRRS